MNAVDYVRMIERMKRMMIKKSGPPQIRSSAALTGLSYGGRSPHWVDFIKFLCIVFST
jgi:hypothetical protein